LKFKLLARIEVFSFLISTFITVALACLNYGVWSLAIGLFVGYLVISICYNLTTKIAYDFVLSKKSFQKIFNFSLNLTLSQFITFLMRYIDDFIIGYFFGKAALGVYDRAYQIVHLPMRLIANRINLVLFPSYSAESTTDEDMRQIHLKIVGYSAYLYFPILIAILIFSPLAVELVLTANWNDLSFYMPVLAIGGTIHAFINFNRSIFLARGRSDLQLKYSVITRLIIVLSYLIGAFWGVKGIAIGYTVGSFIAFFPESIKALKEINANFFNIWKMVKTPFCISLFVLISGKIALYFIASIGYQIFVSSLIYLLCYLFFYRKFINKQKLFLSQKD
jgi:PST family polysaccharide transporter